MELLVGQDAQAKAAALSHCEELSKLLALWCQQSQEVQDTVNEMATLVGIVPRVLSPKAAQSSPCSVERSPPSRSRNVRSSKAAAAPAAKLTGKALDFSSILGAKGLSEYRGRDLDDDDPALDDDKPEAAASASPSASSDGLDLDVDESWTKRIEELDKALDEKERQDKEEREQAMSMAELRSSRSRAPSVLSRIDEGSDNPEEEDEGSSSSSSSTSTSESGEASGESDVERAWASVPEVGFGGSGAVAVQRPAPAPAPAGAEPRQRRRRKKEPATPERASAYVASPVKSGVSEVPASFRTTFRSPGPKESGPLSRMQNRGLDTE